MPYPGKFTVRQRRMICYWFAENSAPSRVATLCEETWGVNASSYKLYEHYAGPTAPLRWRRLIRRYQQMIEQKMAEIPIAKKAVRLAMLNEAARECLVLRTRRIGKSAAVQEMKLGVLAAIIREARNEMEGNKAQVDQAERTLFTVVLDGSGEPVEIGKLSNKDTTSAVERVSAPCSGSVPVCT